MKKDMKPTLNDIAEIIHLNLKDKLDRSGVMYRLFYRAKTLMSLKHKMELKGEKYRSGAGKIQDALGFRIVLYFPDDVKILEDYFSFLDVLDTAVDKPDTCTFSPQRLNMTIRIPDEHIPAFREALPEEYAPYIDDSYEIQLRTVYSEGWHEVEHDLRYKCKEDWVGYEKYSRNLNGVIACLENAEWSVMNIFDKMADENRRQHNIRAMVRNKFRLRFKSEDFSPKVTEFLLANPDVVNEIWDTDRMVLITALLAHTSPVTLTYDRLFFLINRMFIFRPEIRQMESEGDTMELDSFIRS